MKKLKRCLYSMVSLSRKWPRSVLLFWVFAGVLGTASLYQMKFLVLLEDLIDRDFRTWSQLQEVNDNFKDQHQVFVILSGPGGEALNKKQLCHIRSWVQSVVNTSEGVSKVMSSFGVREFYKSGKKLDWMTFLDVDCARPWVDESDKVAAGFSGLTQTPWKALFGKHSDVIVLFDLHPLDEQTRFGVFNSATVVELRDSLNRHMSQEGWKTDSHWGGLGLYLYYLKIGYFWGIAINQVALIFVLLAMWFVFRSWKAGFVYWLAFQASVIPALGLMSFFGKPIDSLNNALPIMVLMACAEDFVFLNYWLRKHKRAVTKTFSSLVVPSFLTSLTTMIGFGSLMFSDFGLARDFGLWAAVAAAFEWIVLVTLVPALFTVFPGLIPTNGGSEFRGRRFYDFLSGIQLRRPVALGLAALSLVPLLFLGHLNYTDAPERIFPENHELRESSRWILQNRGWLTDVSLVFNDDLELSAKSGLLNRIQGLNHVVGMESSHEVISFFKSKMPDSWGEMVFEGWKNSLSGQRLRNEGNDVERALLFLDTTDIIPIGELEKQVGDICGDRCHLAGTLISYSELGHKVMSSFFKSMGGSALLIVLFVVFLFFVTGNGSNLNVMLTVFWGPLLVLGVFVLFQLPVFFVTSISMAILIGVTGDTAIHFVTHRGKSLNRSSQTLGWPSFQAMIIMMLAITPLLFSYYGAMRLLGAIMLLGLALSFVGDVILFRSLYSPRNSRVSHS